MDTTTGVLGYGLVLTGVFLWILSSTVVCTVPAHGAPPSLYYLMGCFDFAVMISAIWFLDKCRCLPTFAVSMLYLLRCGYLVLGYMPSIHFLNIGLSGLQHLNVVAYFIFFSFLAFISLTILWMKEFSEQFIDYRMRHQTWFLNGRPVRIGDVLDDNEAPDIIR